MPLPPVATRAFLSISEQAQHGREHPRLVIGHKRRLTEANQRAMLRSKHNSVTTMHNMGFGYYRYSDEGPRSPEAYVW